MLVRADGCGTAILPSWQIVLLPVFVGAGGARQPRPGASVMTALNVKYRDFRYIIPFIVQFGLYVSPVGFSSAVVPEEWRFWYSLNPVVGVIDGFRWCILGGESPLYLPGFLLSLAVVALFLWLGIALLPPHRAQLRGSDVTDGLSDARCRDPRRRARQEIRSSATRPSGSAMSRCAT